MNGVVANEEGWILNIESTFPLTIYGGEKAVAEELRRLLDSTITLDLKRSTKQILPFINQHNIRCREVDKYIEDFKPLYLKKVDRLIKKPPAEYITPDMNEEEALEEIKFIAADDLDIVPDTDTVSLFEGPPEKFNDALADILCLTYTHGHYAFCRQKQMNDPATLEIIKHWRISAIEDGRTCKLCRKAARRKYPKTEYPKTPLHLGCRCCVVPITKYSKD